MSQMFGLVKIIESDPKIISLFAQDLYETEKQILTCLQFKTVIIIYSVWLLFFFFSSKL